MKFFSSLLAWYKLNIFDVLPSIISNSEFSSDSSYSAAAYLSEVSAEKDLFLLNFNPICDYFYEITQVSYHMRLMCSRFRLIYAKFIGSTSTVSLILLEILRVFKVFANNF